VVSATQGAVAIKGLFFLNRTQYAVGRRSGFPIRFSFKINFSEIVAETLLPTVQME